MLKGETRTGFKYEIEDEVLDDYELVDALAEAAENDGLAMAKAVTLLLGDRKKELMDHCRNDKGRVPLASMLAEIEDILSGHTASKN